MTEEKDNNFQILSLDGGGIKGIYIAAMLANIEQDHNVNISDHFDLIAGTSTGGIIAIGLGLGFTPKEILDMYIQNGETIFQNGIKSTVKHLFKAKHERDPLENVLKSFMGDKKFGDSSKRLIITSFSLSSNDVYLFRTAHASHLIRDYKLEAYKVALSTSAAPTYFPNYNLDGNRLVDGGVWANNPVMVAISEAVGFLDVPLSKIKALSLGTSDEIKQRHESLNEGGLWAWKKEAPDLIMAGQSIGATNQAKIFLGKDRFLRVNSPASQGEFSLDKLKGSDDLIGKAQHDSRVHSQEIQKFLKHKASAFTPLKRP